MRPGVAAAFCVAVGITLSAANAGVYEELVPKYSRTKSNAMVRKIAKPTVANLDYAAYTANPVRYNPEMLKPKDPAKKPGIGDMSFGGSLMAPVNSPAETPLSDAEKEQPVAWTPLQNLLWSELKTDAFARIGNKIGGEKWGDPDIFQAFQEVVAGYLHDADGKTEVWVKIEFSPWVKFLDGITDEDQDGFKEIYGKLNLESVDSEVLNKALDWIRTDYLVRVLNEEQVTDWINILASYWYPTLNTDMVDMTGRSEWPADDTEKKVVKKLRKLVVKNPVAVVRGNPHGKPIYNVFLVPGMGGAKEDGGPATAVKDKKMDTGVSENFKDNTKRFAEEVKAHEGSYEKWAGANTEILAGQKKILDGLPDGQMGYQGTEDWVFFRKAFEYTSAGDLNDQPKEKNPLPNLVEFKKYLDGQNVNLLFVPVPNKAEVYFEKLGVEVPEDPEAIINPYSRKILSDLQEAGIEVIDVLPRLLKAKTEDESTGGSVYQHQDTHWTNRGLQIVAGLIADRIKKYSWFGDLADRKVDFDVIDTTFTRTGDIVDKLPESERTRYPAVELEARQVKLPNGKKYRGERTAPILLIGDSFTGVFEYVDCKSAGVGAHVAVNTGIPVDIITSWGGGPLVRQKMIRARKADMGAKRVVVYMMVARDLYNYSQSWAPLKVE